MGHAIKLVLVIALLAIGLAWLINHPTPEGFKDPWELRKVRAQASYNSFKVYLREYTEPFKDIFLSLRSMGAGPDPQISKVKVTSRDLVFDGVPVRFYTPEALEGDNASPAIVYYHGGCFVIGSVEGYDHFCKSFSFGANVKVVSVEYRRAPEHLFPAAIDDCVTASIYLIKNAEKFGIDPNRIAVAGDSAGGNLAAAASLKLRDLQIKPQPKLQILLVPMLQAIDLQTSSYQLYGWDPLMTNKLVVGGYLLYATGSAKHMYQVMNNEHTTPEIKQKLYQNQLNPDIIPDNLKGEGFVGDRMDYGDAKLWDEFKAVFLNPYFSPLMSNYLKDLPDAIVITMAQDPFRDDGFWYVKLMESFGVEVLHHHYKSGYHGIISWPALYQDNVYEARSILFNLVKERL